MIEFHLKALITYLNIMKTKEIEIWEVNEIADNVVIGYTISDGLTHTDIDNVIIGKSFLIEHLVDSEMNLFCVDVLTGDYEPVDAETYLSENLEDVIKSYLLKTHSENVSL